jgi:6-phosphofructokinase 1
MEPRDFSDISTRRHHPGYFPPEVHTGKAIVDDDGNDLMPAMLDTYNRLNLDCLAILGGNGTQKSAKLFMDAGMNVVTLPKTIDNDIWGTDTTFGFQSAVDIATNVIEYIHSTASAHSRIFVVELMGRDAGWLTLYAGLGSGADVLLLPEIPYHVEKVAEAIERRRKTGRTFTILAVAEGARPAEDAVQSEEERRKERESPGHPTISYRIAQELERLTGQEVRVTIPGHYQRGGPPCPYDRVLATQFGTAAARLIMERSSAYGGQQEGKIVTVPLEEAASKTKFLPVDHPLIQVARDIGVSFGV